MTPERPSDHSRDAETEILRALTPEQKIAAMQGLIQTAFDLKAAWLRTRYPTMDEGDIEARAAGLVTGGSP